MSQTGGCLCGAVRYVLDADPGALINCHCRFCRRAHGAAFVTTTLIATSRLRFVQGEHEIRHHRDRHFCGNCATRLFNRIADQPAATMLIVASLDVEPDREPALHVNVESKAPWYVIRDDAPRFDGLPPGVARNLQGIEEV
jgi:hypothetical protein